MRFAAIAVLLCLVPGCAEKSGPHQAPHWDVGDWWTFEGDDGPFTIQVVAWVGHAAVIVRTPGAQTPIPGDELSVYGVDPATFNVVKGWDRSSGTSWSEDGQVQNPLPTVRFPLTTGDRWEDVNHWVGFFGFEHEFDRFMDAKDAKKQSVAGTKMTVIPIHGSFTSREPSLFGYIHGEGDGWWTDYAPGARMVARATLPEWVDFWQTAWYASAGDTVTLAAMGHDEPLLGLEEAMAQQVLRLPGLDVSPLHTGPLRFTGTGEATIEVHACADLFEGVWSSVEDGAVTARFLQYGSAGRDCDAGREFTYRGNHAAPGAFHLALSSMDAVGQPKAAGLLPVAIGTAAQVDALCLEIGECVLWEGEALRGPLVIEVQDIAAAGGSPGVNSVSVAGPGTPQSTAWNGRDRIEFDINVAGTWRVTIDGVANANGRVITYPAVD